jgi:GNAT superfamily N-acetyltransferase
MAVKGAALAEGYEIVRESIDDRIDDAIAILNETRHNATADAKRCQWMYFENPAGKAQLWVAKSGGELVGFAALVPRRVYVEGQVRRAWITADLSVVRAHRRKGIAGAMRRAAREAIDAGEVDLLYGHPNSKSSGAHRKAGYQCIGEMRRYALVLCTQPYLRKVLRNRTLAGMAARLADPLLGLTRRTRVDASLQIEEVQSFGPEFDDLDRVSTARQGGIIGVRDHRYLQWRYRSVPEQWTAVLAARRGGVLCGYAVLRKPGPSAPGSAAGTYELIDLFPYYDPAVVSTLIAAAIDTARRAGKTSVSASLLDSNPVIPALRRAGFRLRGDRSNMFTYASADRPWHDLVASGYAWYIWDGDRDI